MKTTIYDDAKLIYQTAIQDALPGEAVKRALSPALSLGFGGLIIISIGKAAWDMAKAAVEELNTQLRMTDENAAREITEITKKIQGIVITKHGYSKGEIPGLTVYEAGHPVPDQDTFTATEKVLQMTENLTEQDTVLFLVSGGGSALFEKPLIPPEELMDITDQLLKSGASITEMNTIRKRLSAVKGGRFAQHVAPAKVRAIVLSDIIGDPLDMIASGPAYPDASKCEEALAIARKYQLQLSEKAWQLLSQETPKELSNVDTFITGSVSQLVNSAARTALSLGYQPISLTSRLSCEAREAGSFLGSIGHEWEGRSNVCYIAGGETVVHVTGGGKGGRNQELALSSAKEIAGCREVVLVSVGSDGTDGPTDAAGALVDGNTADQLRATGYDIDAVLKDNNAYPALKDVDSLIFTGPTGTNVNDLSFVLIRKQA